MDIHEEIVKLMEIYAEGSYRETKVISDDDITEESYEDIIELSLEEELIELFQINHIEEFSVNISNVFDSPGLDIYAVSIAYIDKNGKLEHITDSIDRC